MNAADGDIDSSKDLNIYVPETEDSSLELKTRLKWTWKVFFGEFGSLLPVQQKAIPAILEGNNVTVTSATASGKTEAVVCPICENLIDELGRPLTKKGLLVLYLSPTRALVNDIYRRLAGKLEQLGIDCATKTTDRNDFNIKSPQAFLFTTPESADSLLSRHPQVFQNIRGLILDELHLLDGTYRGDQLRLLVRRIADMSKEPTAVKYYAMSATISNPESLAMRYFSPSKSIRTSGSREIEFELIDGAITRRALEQMKEIFYERGFKKALFFCNSRYETVAVCNLLKEIYDRPDRIFEHHSSVSSEIRRFAETEMSKSTNILSLCAATASLEVGIDIGDIDAIVLLSPPPAVSSFLQRIGRGNRRLNKTICYGLHKDIQEKNEFIQMVEFARQGRIEIIKYVPDISVGVQQLISMVFQYNNLGYSGVPKIIASRYLEILGLSEEEIDLLLMHLGDTGWIKIQFEKVVATRKLLDFDDQFITKGKINSNIPKGTEFKVVDETGKEIGEISLMDASSDRFILGGYKWQTIGVSKNTIKARRIMGDASVPQFPGKLNRGYYYSWLPEKLQK